MTTEQTMPTGLYWQGKKAEVERIILPFQTIETINESRATREKEKKTGPDMFKERADDAWRNRLIWGDNKYVMASLLPEFAGKIDLIYIDPPFATGADFSVKMEIGDVEWTKEPSAIEDKAYRDTWGKGLDSYLQMMYERLVLMRELLSDKGSIYVHLDWHVGHYVKIIMDEIFGRNVFLNNIVWCYQTRQFSKRYWNRKHDDILVYAKIEDQHVFNWDVEGVLQPYSEATLKKYKLKDENGHYRLCGRGISGSPIRSAKDVDPMWEKTNPELVVRDYLGKGFAPHDYWMIDIVNQAADERLDYATQKPEKVVEK